MFRNIYVIRNMNCGCGAEYKVYEHKNGYSIRCIEWEKHEKEKK